MLRVLHQVQQICPAFSKNSFRDILPPACDTDGCPLSLAHQLENINEITKINLKLDWGDEGEEVTDGSAGFAIFDPKTNMLAVRIVIYCLTMAI